MMNNNPGINLFSQQGFLLFNNSNILSQLQLYAFDWVNSLFDFTLPNNLATLHQYIVDDNVYSTALVQANRHKSDPDLIHLIISTYGLSKYFSAFFPKGWKIWDEGFGSLGLRLVRPNSNDGYNWSMKAWGPAKSVLSVSICIFSTDQSSSISIIPSSHTLSDLPVINETSIHCKDELRLNLNLFSISNSITPCGLPGNLILMHPCLLHTEKNHSKCSTRLSLEFRICAL